MAKGIVINFLSDVRDLLRGTNDAEKALDEVADSLDGVAKDGEKATEKLEKSFKELAKEASRSGKEAGDGIGRSLKQAEVDGSQSMKDLKEESLSTAKESAASFDGSAESIIDAFQEIAANAFVGFGAAGIAAGLAAAAGIGIASQEILKAEENSKAAKERVGELAGALIDAQDAGVPLSEVADNLKDLAIEAEGVRKPLKDIKKEAEDLGLEFGALATAYAQGTEALDDQIKTLELLTQQGLEERAAQQRGESEWSAAQDKRLEGLGTQLEELKKVQEETRLAQEAEQNWLASGGAEMLAKAEAIDGINASYDDVVGSAQDFLNEEGKLNGEGLEQFIASIQERQDALNQYQVDLASMGLSTDQKNALNDMGIDAAMAYLDGIKNGTPEQAKFLKDSLTEAAKDSSASAKKELEKAFANPVEAKVKAELDSLQAQRDLDNLIKARTAIIKLDFVDRNGQRYY